MVNCIIEMFCYAQHNKRLLHSPVSPDKPEQDCYNGKYKQQVNKCT